jgi:hypothetical protein
LFGTVILISAGLLRPTVGLKAAENRTFVGPSVPSACGNQIRESTFHLPEGVDLLVDISDLGLRSFADAIAAGGRIDAQPEQFLDLV